MRDADRKMLQYMLMQAAEVYSSDNVHYTRENLRKDPSRIIPDDYVPTENELWRNYINHEANVRFRSRFPDFYRVQSEQPKQGQVA